MLKLFVLLVGLLLGFDAFSTLRNGFEAYGDLMQFFAAFLAFFFLINKDLLAFLQLLLSAFIALGLAHTSKAFFEYLATTEYAKLAHVSMRPNQEDFDGFPSGHSTASFIAAGFICKKYGFKLGIFAVVIAGLVAISRLYVERHTILQVVCGSLLGFFVAYFIADSKLFRRFANG